MVARLSTEFINTRPRGGSGAAAACGPIVQAQEKVFCGTTKAEPFLKLEDLRFPVGSVIVLENARAQTAAMRPIPWRR